VSVFEEKKGEAETLAGFVLEISKSFPKINSKINFKTYSFTVEALSNKRIKQLKVTLKNNEATQLFYFITCLCL